MRILKITIVIFIIVTTSSKPIRRFKYHFVNTIDSSSSESSESSESSDSSFSSEETLVRETTRQPITADRTTPPAGTVVPVVAETTPQPAVADTATPLTVTMAAVRLLIANTTPQEVTDERTPPTVVMTTMAPVTAETNSQTEAGRTAVAEPVTMLCYTVRADKVRDPKVTESRGDSL